MSSPEPAVGVTPVLRPATPADLAAVARIYAHYVLRTTITFEVEAPDVAEWRVRFDRLTEAGWPFHVLALPAGRHPLGAPDGVVGYGYVGPWRPRPAYRFTVEDTLYLDPAWTGRGLGGPLLDRLLVDAAAAGAREAIAVIADDEAPASVALHERHGFRRAGRLEGVGFKLDRWVGTTLMQKSLG
jgi:phosphinothricin acetyltransferase